MITRLRIFTGLLLVLLSPLVWAMPLHTGDLLFLRLQCGVFCRAVSQASIGAKHQLINHVGMVVSVKGGDIQVIQASFKGVVLTPLKQFLIASHGRVMVGRLKTPYQHLIPKAVKAAKHDLGEPYNFSFRPSAHGFYCSQLITRAFRTANDGKSFFKLIPMTFKNKKTGHYFPEWIAYYKKLGVAIPEGKLGSNPAELSKSAKIQIVSLL